MPSGWPSPMASDWRREFSRRRCAWDRIRAARRKLEYPTRERGYVVCSALSSVAETEALTEEEDFQGMGLFVRCVFLGLPVGRGSARDAGRSQVSRSPSLSVG